MIVIEQTDMDLGRAREYADMVDKNLKKVPNYTGLTAENRYYVGYRGELAVDTWLERCQVPYVYRVALDGNSQTSEFLLNDKRIEIKTASQPWHRKVMFPAAQDMEFFALIGARLRDEGTVELHGWLPRAGIEDAMPVEMVKIATRSCLLHRMNPLDTLFEYCGIGQEPLL